MSSDFRKFLNLNRQRRRLLLEAFARLAQERWNLARTPFRDRIGCLQKNARDSRHAACGTEVESVARDIGWAVRTAASRTPWNSSCLVQVLAAQHMLQSRGIGGVFYIGAAKGEPSIDPDFQAHAWLMCGGEFISGEAGHDRFTVISEFSWN